MPTISGVIRNAHAISIGVLPPTALGARAPDDKTLVVTLEHPASYLPELLTHDTAYPLPRHVVLAKGEAWSKPENFVGNGPFLPREWIVNDHLTLVKNPRFYDAAHVRLDEEIVYPTADSGAALRRLRAGELDTQTPIPLTEMAWLRRHMPAIVHTTPFLGLSYIVINLEHLPLGDLRIRRALNLAMDREVIADKVLRLGRKAGLQHRAARHRELSERPADGHARAFTRHASRQGALADESGGLWRGSSPRTHLRNVR